MKITKTQIQEALRQCIYDPKDEFMATFLIRHDVSYLEARASDLLMEALQIVKSGLETQEQIEAYSSKMKLAIQFAITAWIRRNGPIQPKKK